MKKLLVIIVTTLMIISSTVVFGNPFDKGVSLSEGNADVSISGYEGIGFTDVFFEDYSEMTEISITDVSVKDDSIVHGEEGSEKKLDASTYVITIENENELNKFADFVNGTDSNPHDFLGYTVILIKNIYLSDPVNSETSNFTPIGNDAKRFNGTFDGQGYEISNLTVDISKENEWAYVGIFGYIGSEGVVKNVSIVGDMGVKVNISVTVDTTPDSNVEEVYSAYLGGIAGYNVGTIQNCEYSGDVSVYTSAKTTIGSDSTIGNGVKVKIDSNAYVGGIVGCNDGAIESCYNIGDMSVNAEAETIIDPNADVDDGSIVGTTSNACVGGIVGFNYCGSISNCYNAGTVTSSSNTYAYTGGITGLNNNVVQNCYNVGDIEANASRYTFAGSIAGVNYGAISNCYNVGDVSATSTAHIAYSGGIVGWNPTSDASIEGCYNTGDINAISKYYAYAGGIVGWNPTSDASIEGCYNTGDINAISKYYAYAGGITGWNDGGKISNCSNAGNTSADSGYQAFAGGITGWNYGGTINSCQNVQSVNSTINSSQITNELKPSDVRRSYAAGISGINISGKILNCSNAGSAIAKNDTSADSYTFAGGITGSNEQSYATIQNCYNIGDVSLDILNTESNFKHYAFIGGIAGYYSLSTESTEETKAIIENCYHAGSISYSSKESDDVSVGNIVGYANGTIENNYYLEDTITNSNEMGISFKSDGTFTEGSGTLLNALNEWVESKESGKYRFWMNETLPVFTDWLREAEDMGVMMIPNDDGIYEITHPYQLALIANDLNGHYILLNDIDLSEYSWTPIGNSDSKFTGTFDGQGHEITNMIVSGDIQYAGLFGCIGYSGVVKNVKVSYAIIDVDSSSPTWADIIAGQNNGTIENSFGLGIVNSDLKMSEIDEGGKDNTIYYILAVVVVVLVIIVAVITICKKD